MIQVFLADDHSIFREGLAQILADTDDITVTGEAGNGIDLMTRLRAGVCDVLVLDITMPGRSGIELIKTVHREYPGLPILILSMHHEQQYAVRSIRAGAAGYLTKESDSEVLIGAIRHVAAGGVHITTEVAELIARSLREGAEVPPHTLLSDREYQVFELLVIGHGLTRIAESLSVSVKTVSTHKTRIMQKMALTTVSDLVRYAIAHGLTELPQ